MAKNCINCNNPLPDEAVFCTVCGTRQPENQAACPQCGAPLMPGAAFCTVCGTALNTAPAQPAPVQNTPPQQAQPVYPQASPVQQVSQPAPAAAQPPQPQAPQPQNTYAPPQQTAAQPAPAPMAAQAPADKPKKSKKKWIITGIGAGALALAAVIFFVFILPLFAKSAGTEIIFKNGGKTYYASPYVMMMNGDNLTQVRIEKSADDETERYFSYFPEFDVQSGSAFYCINRTYDLNEPYKNFAKITFTAKDKVKESEWLAPGVLESAPFNDNDASKEWLKYTWIHFLRNACTDGKYVYYTMIPSQEHITTRGDIAGKVVRISLDGKTAEQFSDINATDITIDGGWLYYFDTGYTPNSESFTKSIDRSRAGLYKIKTNGSGKKLIHAMTLTEEQASMGQYNLTSPPCGGLKVVDNKLYFIDYTEGGKGKLCRINTNGKGYEILSTTAVSQYAIDADHHAAYCYSGRSDDRGLSLQYNNDPVLFKCDMKSKTEAILPTVKYGVDDMTYSKGYVYFASYSNFRYGNNENARVGLRMNVKTNEWQWVSGYREENVGWRINSETGKREHYNEIDDPHPSWVPAETK